MGILTNLGERDVLFIDEIHRLPRAVEELLYPAMEDFSIHFVMDKGLNARTMRIPLRPFTLVGATTRPGMLSSPLRERFGIFHHLDFYSVEDLCSIILRSASILGAAIEPSGAEAIARRSRGTPRIANRLLRRVRDYCQVKGDGVVTAAAAGDALDREGVDDAGLDRLDRRFLIAIIEQYRGGPVGLEAIAATINDEAETLAEVVEPFLLKIGYVVRSPNGRKATAAAYAHLGYGAPAAEPARGSSRSDRGAFPRTMRELGKLILGFGARDGYPGRYPARWREISRERCHGSDDCREIIYVEREHWKVYVPLGTSILISIVASIVLTLLFALFGRR